MSTFTGTTLISDALRDIGVLGVGRSLNDRDGSFALRYLQRLIDSAELDRRVIYTVLRSSYTLVANTASRTIGPSGNFVQARPIFIASALVKRVGEDLETPLHIMTRDEYLYYHDKTLTSEVPDSIFMEPTVTNATLYFLPIPTTAATLVVGTPTALTGFSDLSTTYTFTPGYEDWFLLRLRNKLARPFGRPLTQDMRDEEALAHKAIERVNDSGPPIMVNDYGDGHGGYQIETGTYRR